MSINKYTYDNLLNNKIWFNSVLNFNDPYDFFIPVNLNFTDKTFIKNDPFSNNIDPEYSAKIRKCLKNNPDKLHAFYQKGVENTAKDFLISCFSETAKEILMWSHYADYHRGICLKFDSSLDKQFFHKEDNCCKKGKIRKVKYPKKYKKINYFEDPKKFFFTNVYTKYHKWKYEKEWRLFSRSHSIQFKKESLVGVIFGCRTSKKDYENICKLVKQCKYPNVEFILAKRSKDKFELEFETIDHFIL